MGTSNDYSPEDIGYKALAVNLSDLAAMAARPAWATLALTLPRADEGWIAGFARGFFDVAEAHGVALVGGDLTRGPLTITVGVYGFAPTGLSLRRSGARPGDEIFVTGTLGDAALAWPVCPPHTARTWRRACAAPHHGWPKGSPCGAWPPAGSISPTAWPPLSVIS